MAAEYSYTGSQIVQPGASVLFNVTPVPCGRGFIFHRDGSGLFRLASRAPTYRRTCCGNVGFYESQYVATFTANVAIPEGGTVAEIQLAMVMDGEVQPESTMIQNPTVVDTPDGVGKSIVVGVPSICKCSSFAIRNVGTTPVEILNPVLLFAESGICEV